MAEMQIANYYINNGKRTLPIVKVEPLRAACSKTGVSGVSCTGQI